MRNYTMNIRLAAVMVAPLLLACGSDNTGGGTNLVTVPDCGGAANSVLTTDSTGQLQCVPLPAGAVSLPDCSMPAGQALTADGTQPSCTNLNALDATTQTLLTTLTDIEKKIVDYGTTITAYQTAAGGQATYVGLTAATTDGRILFTDAKGVQTVGIPAATNMCVKEFGARSHMCTVYELYVSSAVNPLKKFSATTDINPGGWAYLQSGRYPTKLPPAGTAVPAPAEPDNGLADNCGGYTYNGTTANGWNGTVFQWINSANRGIRVPHFFGNTLCNVQQSIACCR